MKADLSFIKRGDESCGSHGSIKLESIDCVKVEHWTMVTRVQRIESIRGWSMFRELHGDEHQVWIRFGDMDSSGRWCVYLLKYFQLDFVVETPLEFNHFLRVN